MHTIKYRMTEKELCPRRTKLQIPGWAGEPEPRADGSHEYAWHCVPFSEAAQYGVEVFYPYDNELRVTTEGGQLLFQAISDPPLTMIAYGRRSGVSGNISTPINCFST